MATMNNDIDRLEAEIQELQDQIDELHGQLEDVENRAKAWEKAMLSLLELIHGALGSRIESIRQLQD